VPGVGSGAARYPQSRISGAWWLGRCASNVSATPSIVSSSYESDCNDSPRDCCSPHGALNDEPLQTLLPALCKGDDRLLVSKCASIPLANEVLPPGARPEGGAQRARSAATNRGPVPPQQYREPTPTQARLGKPALQCASATPVHALDYPFVGSKPPKLTSQLRHPSPAR